MRTIVLSDDAGSGAPDPLWFPGGHQLQNIKGTYMSLLPVKQLQKVQVFEP